MAEQRGEGVYNVVVIGAGTAGLVTAAGAAAFGARVALVERARMGGDCLNAGCVPSKALLSSARLAFDIRQAQDRGLSAEEPGVDVARVMARVRERRAAIAPNDSQERFEALGVDVFRGHARFLSDTIVDVEGLPLAARNVVIATGSRPRLPDIEGLKDARFYTNETIFDRLEARPGRLVVIGGGPIGCELGQAFARLGASTTIVQSADRILEKEDEDTSRGVHDRLQAEGVRIVTGATVRLVARSESVMRVWAELGNGERLPIDGDTLLVAAGREPNVEGLDLDRAGIASDEKGIRVDEHLRTSRRHIFAAGDVASPYRFTHVAEAQARTIVRNLLLPRFPVRWDDAVVPWCTFTDPELARVGLSERQAAERGIRCDVWRRAFSDTDRAVVESRTEGFAKILTARGSDLILGAAIVGHGAGDLIHEIVIAMKAGLGLTAISGTIHVYPTFAEVVRRAADERQKSRLTPARRRFTRWLFRRRRGA